MASVGKHDESESKSCESEVRIVHAMLDLQCQSGTYSDSAHT